MWSSAQQSLQHHRVSPSRRIHLVVVAATLCALVVACGGNDGDTAAGTDQGSSTTAVTDSEVAPVADCGARRKFESDGPPLDLSGCDLSGQDLSFLLMVDGSFVGTNLSGANLDNAYAGFADLSGANLGGADVSAVDFFESNLTGANFVGAAGSPANFEGSDLTGANLTDACLVILCLTWETPEEIAEVLESDPGGLEVVVELYASDDTKVLEDVVYGNTICPDGTNSDANGGTCDNHLLPARYSALPQLLGQS